MLPTSKKPKVLKLNSPDLIKIRVQEIINNDGWEKKNFFGIGELQLRPVVTNNNQEIYIELVRDNEICRRWKVGERTIGQLPIIHLPDGTIRRRSPPLQFFVYGRDGKRYRYLYFRLLNDQSFDVATRTDMAARYATNCRSRKQRKKSFERGIAREKRYLRKLQREHFPT
jgi:hypothetical protein